MGTVGRFGFMLLMSVLGTVHAQSYPSKPIRIHTAGAGANPDFVSRLVATELSTALGQPVLVENRPSGFVLATGVAKAAPDGHTLLINGSTVWIAPLFGEAPYDAIRDFAPIAMLSQATILLIVNPSLPVKSVAELMSLARAKPGSLNYSSGANGSTAHIAMELLKSLTGTDIVRISYKDQMQQDADMLSGRVPLTFGNASTWAAMLKSGKVRAIASASARRSALYPDVPTVGETLPGFVAESLLAFFAPAKTPDAIVRRLNQETVRLLDKADVRERLLQSGQEPVGGSPQQLADSIKSEIARVSKLISETGTQAGS